MITSKQLRSMKKDELLKLVSALHKENKELKAVVEKDKSISSGNKNYSAVTVFKNDKDGYCTALVRFSEADIVDVFQYEKTQPHMARYKAQEMLVEKIFGADQKINITK